MAGIAGGLAYRYLFSKGSTLSSESAAWADNAKRTTAAALADPTFKAAVDYGTRHGRKLSIVDKLRLYGLYKQATCGPCPTYLADMRPSMADIAARAKWDSWNECGAMPSAQALRLYLAACDELFPSWREKALAGGGSGAAAAAGGNDSEGDDDGGDGGAGFSLQSRPAALMMDAAALRDAELEEAEAKAEAAAAAAAAGAGAGTGSAGSSTAADAGATEAPTSGSSAATAAAAGAAGSFPRSLLSKLRDLAADGDIADLAQLLAAHAGTGIARAVLNSAGETALHVAADAGREDAVAALLAAGADPRAQEAESGCTALHYAVMTEHAGVAGRIAAADADAVKAVLDADGVSAWDMAQEGSAPEELREALAAVVGSGGAQAE